MIENEHFLHHGNHAGKLLLKNGEIANYGSIRVENDKAIYWSGKGLYEVWNLRPTEDQMKSAAELKKKTEEELIASDHIHITPLSEIERVID